MIDPRKRQRLSEYERRRLSNAERQRRFYWNQKKKLQAAPDPSDAISRKPFNEFLTNDADHDWTEVLTALEWAGINPDHVPDFSNDEDPGHDPELDGDAPNRGSIGRAERMVMNLLDAATLLAGIINQYKRDQIDAAIADVEANGITDPARKKDAIAKIVRLTKMRERLDKRHRHELPEWSLKGF